MVSKPVCMLANKSNIKEKIKSLLNAKNISLIPNPGKILKFKYNKPIAGNKNNKDIKIEEYAPYTNKSVSFGNNIEVLHPKTKAISKEPLLEDSS